MKIKKRSAEWYISATHWLTSTIGMVLISLTIKVVLSFLHPNLTNVTYLYYFLYPVVMLLCVIYSAKYVNRTYIIKDVNKIVAISMVYMIIIVGGFIGMNFLSNGLIYPDYIGLIFAIILFYFVSNKYLKVV